MLASSQPCTREISVCACAGMHACVCMQACVPLVQIGSATVRVG